MLGCDVRAAKPTTVARIQFALAGMNAHINHDLPEAIVATCKAMNTVPQHGTWQYHDYTATNSTLNGLIDTAKKALRVRLLGDPLPPISHLEDTIAAWSLATAREKPGPVPRFYGSYKAFLRWRQPLSIRWTDLPRSRARRFWCPASRVVRCRIFSEVIPDPLRRKLDGSPLSYARGMVASAITPVAVRRQSNIPNCGA